VQLTTRQNPEASPARAELTVDPADYIRAKQDPRPADIANLVARRELAHRGRVYTGAAITGFGALS
jgi:hypothetical protein